MLKNLEADRACVAETAAQLHNLEHLVAKLRAEQAAAQERLDSYKYPVLTLPNEIVSEIFIHFLATYSRFHSPIRRSILTPLTEICRKWREIALATPALWSGIAFCDSDIPTSLRHRTSCSSPISEWLRRSSSHPLSILIIDQYSSPSDMSRATIATLVQHRARWEHAKLHLRDSVRLIDVPLPRLRHLDLTLSSPTILWGFHDLPQLRSVVLNRVAAMSVTLPWAQLTSLTLRDGIERSGCLAILKQTKTLVHCTLNLSEYRGFMDPDINVSLPCLKTLIFTSHGAWGESVVDFLATLIVPALIELRIPQRFLGTNPSGSLSSFISKSGCTLQELRIWTENSLECRHLRDGYREAFPSIQGIFVESESSQVIHY
ncbi:F-box domain-containing protein [Mycena sanguinolenta]|uniref:F-box domain-containing protein n=1 Tax=Mycena sanguinolenta TaxID=230812 RepID=A0A8H7D8P4_9AGAR|nr:F-box domain-containing protein [Mycena sanguinolenta]